MYRRILIPLDGSPLAEAPLRYAAWLAQKTGVELVLLNVYSDYIPPMSHYLRMTAQLLTIRSHQHRGGRLPALVRTKSVRGDPATQILRYAEDNDVDLIAMSTHGHSGMKHWLLGSVADRVARYSNKPVWLTKAFGIAGRTDYDSMVLVLLDGSELAEQILPFAAYHAGLGGGELVLLSVCESPDVAPAVTYHLNGQDFPPTRPAQWDEYVREEAGRREKECRVYLDQTIKAYSGTGYTVRHEYRFGEPATEIARYLENNPISLVAMTTRGRSGLSRWVFGSLTEKLLSTATGPFLIMRPKELKSKE